MMPRAARPHLVAAATASMALALLVLSDATPALACSTCITYDETSLKAYRWMTILLCVLPVVIFGCSLLWYLKASRRAHGDDTSSDVATPS